MKTILILGFLVFTGITLFFFVQSYFSKAYAAPGINIDKLEKCPSKPNCICSEYMNDSAHFFQPIKFSDTPPSELITKIETILKKMDASSIATTNNYIAATFTSTFFRFIDDFEIRIDTENNLIHLRSASRTGSSDFGVNRKRATAFQSLFEKSMTATD